MKNLEIEMTKIIFSIRRCMITFLRKRIKFPWPRTSHKKVKQVLYRRQEFPLRIELFPFTSGPLFFSWIPGALTKCYYFMIFLAFQLNGPSAMLNFLFLNFFVYSPSKMNPQQSLKLLLRTLSFTGTGIGKNELAKLFIVECITK